MEPTSFLLSKLFSEAYNELKSYLKKKDIRLARDETYIRESILSHINYVSNWSKEIDFKDLDKAKPISKVYVKLDYYLNLTRDNLQPKERERIKLSKVFSNTHKHVVLLGQPGAGKTTTMKFICHSLFHDEKFHPEYHFPVLIRLRDLSQDKFSNSQELLFDSIFTTLGLKINSSDSLTTDYSYSNIRECVLKLIDELGVLLVLDGFDEINPPEKKDKIIKEFEHLCLNLSRSRIILTSRLGDYNYSINNTVIYEISSLTEDQIEQFAKRWLVKPEKYKDLQSQIVNSPFYDTAIRPLTMAHLCALYERFGTIPDKPKNIYKKIITLLIEEWDSQRMIHRKSSFVGFTTDRKAEFLSVFAFYLTTQIQKSIFTKAEISKIYHHICEDFQLRSKDEKNVLLELEGQTGLLIQSGYDSFEFAHKSLQEYLTSEYLIRLPVTPTNSRHIDLMPNELAIATSISTDPSIYLSGLVINGFSGVSSSTCNIFISRLVLEKPDFKVEPLLATAFLYLRQLMGSFNIDEQPLLELLEYSSGLNKSIQKIPEFYTREGDFPTRLVKLHLNKPIINPYSINPPLEITVESPFLDKIGLRNWP